MQGVIMNQQFDKQNQKQPTSGQLKKSLALQLAVYRQIAIARRLNVFRGEPNSACDP